MKNTLRTKEITRQDLLQMGDLSGWLEDHDLLLISNRGELDAVMATPASLLSLLAGNISPLVSAIDARLNEDATRSITEREASILEALTEFPMRLSELADRLGQQSSNLHRRLQEMVDEELITRQEEDEITYAISPLGVNVLHRAE